MRITLVSLLLCLWSLGFSQDSKELDSKYLEDQFYVGITYNFLLNKPGNVTQRNLSYGLQGGFIKDLPINKERTKAFGIGLGYAFNSYYSDMLAMELNGDIVYLDVDDRDDIGSKRNKVETHLVEMPIEFRWRNSTPEEYRFWLIYAGLKLGYVFGARSKFIPADANEVFNRKIAFYNTDVRKFHYGLTFNFGWNTFNLHIYYSLNNLFNDGVMLGTETIDLKPLRIGFIFYIL